MRRASLPFAHMIRMVLVFCITVTEGKEWMGRLILGEVGLRVDRGSNILVQQHLEDSRNFVESLLPLKQHGFIGAFTGLMPFPMCGHPLVTSFRSHAPPKFISCWRFRTWGNQERPRCSKSVGSRDCTKKEFVPISGTNCCRL